MIPDRANKLLLASTNPGKIKEFKVLLSVVRGITLVTLMDVGAELKVAETGKSYAENAELKARAFCRESGLISLADDSGLEVDALDGAPGLYSARYAPQAGATDADRRAVLLENLAGTPQPWRARFRAAICIALPNGNVRTTEGVCEGEIIPEERGSNGFGYDPIFYIPALGLTMAELSDQKKNRVSHRARGVAEMIPILQAVFDA